MPEQKIVTDAEAFKTLQKMRDAAVSDYAELKKKFEHEQNWMARDVNPYVGWRVTELAAQVERKRMEATTLAIAVTKFTVADS